MDLYKGSIISIQNPTLDEIGFLGPGFYLTNNKDIADMEAITSTMGGYSSMYCINTCNYKYENMHTRFHGIRKNRDLPVFSTSKDDLKTSYSYTNYVGLKIFDATATDITELQIAAMLSEYLNITLSEKATINKECLIKNYMPDYKDFDIIIIPGNRCLPMLIADFLEDDISLEKLSLFLGKEALKYLTVIIRTKDVLNHLQFIHGIRVTNDPRLKVGSDPLLEDMRSCILQLKMLKLGSNTTCSDILLKQLGSKIFINNKEDTSDTESDDMFSKTSMFIA